MQHPEPGHREGLRDRIQTADAPSSGDNLGEPSLEPRGTCLTDASPYSEVSKTT